MSRVLITPRAARIRRKRLTRRGCFQGSLPCQWPQAFGQVDAAADFL